MCRFWSEVQCLGNGRPRATPRDGSTRPVEQATVPAHFFSLVSTVGVPPVAMAGTRVFRRPNMYPTKRIHQIGGQARLPRVRCRVTEFFRQILRPHRPSGARRTAEQQGS